MQIKNIIDSRKQNKKSKPHKEILKSNEDVSNFLSITFGDKPKIEPRKLQKQKNKIKKEEIKKEEVKKEEIKKEEIKKEEIKKEEIKITKQEIHLDFEKVAEFTSKLYVGQYEIKKLGQRGLKVVTYINGDETENEVIKQPISDIRTYGNKIKKSRKEI